KHFVNLLVRIVHPQEYPTNPLAIDRTVRLPRAFRDRSPQRMHAWRLGRSQRATRGVAQGRRTDARYMCSARHWALIARGSFPGASLLAARAPCATVDLSG